MSPAAGDCPTRKAKLLNSLQGFPLPPQGIPYQPDKDGGPLSSRVRGKSVELRKWSWVKLLVFCVTGVFVAALVLALLLATATLALASEPDEKPASNTAAKTFSGIVTDSFCGARHEKDSSKSPEECSRECLRNGAQFVLVSGDAKYVLAGNKNILNGLVGQRARISGVLEGNILHVGSVSFTP
jgi:hypothetical protein